MCMLLQLVEKNCSLYKWSRAGGRGITTIVVVVVMMIIKYEL